MNVEHFLLACVGSVAYEALFWKEMITKEIVEGVDKIRFRRAYYTLLAVWVPLCGVIAYYLFEDDITKSGNYIIIGFAMPSILKTFSSRITGSKQQQLGNKEAFTEAAKQFFSR